MKKIAVAALAALLLLTACAAPGAIPAATVEQQTPAPEETRAPQTTADVQSLARLPLVRHEKTYGEENALIYPAVDAEGYSALNDAILNKITAALGRIDAPVYTYFNVKCNEGGILSLLVSYFDMATRELCLELPMTFDVLTGEELAIEDCFDPENESWRSIIPDAVRAQAKSAGMVLLSDILPIEDGQFFYLTGRSLVILYRPYEITTYSAGWPEFAVGYDVLSACFGEGAAVNRLLASSLQVKG